MGGEENGLTLEGLAQRLEGQTQRLEALERENARLRSEVAMLRGSGTHRVGVEEEPAIETSEPEERMSRRGLLSKAGAAALGIVAAGALTQLDIREAKADIVSGYTDTSGRGAVEGTNESASGYGVWGNSNYWGVRGDGDVIGVNGEGGSAGVRGKGGSSYGVIGETDSAAGIGVKGVALSFTGVMGIGKTGVLGTGSGTTGSGVRGTNPDAIGVTGSGKIGVSGQSSTAGLPAIYGQHIGTGGIGVRGDGVKGGYGGQFSGGKAQLRLVPGSTAGKPTTGAHTKGELYMDSATTLWVCAASGSPGVWRRVTTTAT